MADSMGPKLRAPLSTPTGSTRFGYSVSSAGDVNGDSYGDVIVGSYGSDTAYVYLGGPSGLSASPTTLRSPSGGHFGYSVAGVGDVNGDGYDDVAVGAWGLNAVYVYLGSMTGVGSTASLSLVGPFPAGDGHFGATVAGAGDVNGDGFADIVVGSPTRNAAYLFLGRAGALGPSADLTLMAPAGSLQRFGNTVAGAGDLDGNGYADLIVGTHSDRAHVYRFDGGSSLPMPMTLSGAMGSGFGGIVARLFRVTLPHAWLRPT